MVTHGERTSRQALVAHLRRWKGWLATLAVGLVLLAAAVGAGIASLSTLHSTEASLGSERTELSDASTRLDATRSELSTVTAQSRSAAVALAGESAQLGTERRELASAQADVSAKGINISDLDSCLSSVEEALNQIALGDSAGASATITGASHTCLAADPSLP
jgi:hypothetical protein